MIHALLILVACGSRPAAPPTVVADRSACDSPAACTAACDTGDALACNQLALWLQDGLHGAAHDPVQASVRYGRACDLGAGIGCYNLAHMKVGGQGIPADPDATAELLVETRAHYQASCDAGGLTWCANLAGLLQRGEGAPPSAEAARDLYRTTCDRGDAMACLELANMLDDGEGGPRDPDAAIALLRRTCDGGRFEACNNLALTLEARGEDPRPIFQRACDQGVAIGCRNLAVRMTDPAEALPLLQRACDLPVDLDPVACVLAGSLLAKPDTVDQAFTYQARACSMGVVEGCLDALVLVGEGQVDVDLAMQTDLVERACSLGNAGACEALRPVPAPAPAASPE